MKQLLLALFCAVGLAQHVFAFQDYVVDGSTYAFPDVDDQEWGQDVTDWAGAVTNAVTRNTNLLRDSTAAILAGSATTYAPALATAQSTAALTLTGANTNYIAVGNTLQSGASFYVLQASASKVITQTLQFADNTTLTSTSTLLQLTSTQTFSGQNSFSNQVTVSSTVVGDSYKFTSSTWGVYTKNNQPAIAVSSFGVVSFSTQSCLRAFRSASLTVTSGVNTAIPFDGVTFDNQSEYSTASSSFTPKVAGNYLILASVAWNSFGSDQSVTLSIFKNGAAIQDNVVAVVNGITQYQQLYGIVQLVPGDLVSIVAFQSTGGNGTIIGGTGPSKFTSLNIVKVN